MVPVAAEAWRQRLSDRSAPRATRVKFAWKLLSSRRLKDDVVVGYLVDSLHALETSIENEGAALDLWKLLFKILKRIQKSSSHEGTSSKFSSLLPSLFGSTLLNWISYVTSPFDADSELVKWVIKCAELVLRTRGLDNIFSKHFDLLNSLVATCLDLLCSMTQCRSESNSTLKSVVLCLLKNYSHLQHMRSDVVKVFGLMTTTLLGKSVNEILLASSESDGDVFGQQLQRYVSETVINALAKSPVHADFEQLMLTVLTNENSPKHLQYLVDFLKLIQDCNNAKFRNDLVVQMFHNNAEPNKKVRAFHRLHYLVLLCRLLGIDPLSSHGKYIKLQSIFMVRFCDDEVCLAHFAALLQKFSQLTSNLRSKQEVDLMQPLNYFQSLADFLLINSTFRSRSSFRCLSLLLSLNSTVLVPSRTSSVLTKAWLSGPMESGSDSLDSRLEFLCALLDIYVKLRQVDKFILKLLDVIGKAASSMTKTNSFRPPKKFLDRFGAICADLHPIQAVSVWNALLDVVNVSHDKATDNKQDVEYEYMYKSQPAFDLLKTLLQCVRLVGVNLPKDALDAIVLASKATAKCCNNRLVSTIVITKITPDEILLSSLQLVYCWQELHAILMSYSNKYALSWLGGGDGDGDSVQSISNLLAQYFFVSDSDLCRIGKACERKDHIALNHIYLLLLLQRTKLLVIFGDETYEDWKSQLHSSIHIVISLVNSHVQKGYVQSWATVCKHLPVLALRMSPQDVQNIASEIVSTFSDGTPDNKLGHVTSHMLRSHEFQDVAVFQTAIVTTNLQRMAMVTSALYQRFGCGFLKKIIKALKAMHENTEMSFSAADSDNGLPDECDRSVLIKICEPLGKIFSSVKKENESQIGSLERYDGCFAESCSLLDELPLEYLLPVNRIRCLAQALCVLYVATEYREVGLEESNLALSALRIVTSLLKDQQKENLCSELLLVHELMSWITKSFTEFVAKVQTIYSDQSPNVAKHIIHQMTDLLTSLTASAIINGESVFVGFSKFLEDFELSTQKLLKRHHDDADYLIAVLACAMLRTCDQVASNTSSRVKVCREFAMRLSNCFVRWFGTVSERIRNQNFQLVIVFLEAFGLMLRLQPSDDTDSAWKQAIPSFLQYALTEVLSHRELFIAIEFLKEFRPFIAESAVKDLWNAACAYEEKNVNDVVNLHLEKNFKSSVDNLIIRSNIGEFKWILDDLISKLSVNDLLSCHTARVSNALCKWSAILKSPLTSDKADLVIKESGRFLVLCQHLLLQTEGKSSITILLMRAETDLLKKQISSENVMLILQGCSSLDLTKIANRGQFVRCFDAFHGLLRSVLVYQARFVVHAVPSFLAPVQHLMRAIILQGQQHLVKDLPEDQITEICRCAQKLEGLFSLMTNHKMDFAKVAPYVVAFYVTEAPNVTLYTPIKNTLMSSIFAMLSMCNSIEIPPLLAALGQSGREVFNALYQDYKKYYRYTGKV